MTNVRQFRLLIPSGITACALIWGVMGAGTSQAQDNAKKAPKAAPKAAAAPQKAAPKRPALTEKNLQDLWDGRDEELLLNELKLRGLAFHPEENWVGRLQDPAGMPRAIAAIRALIEPAPEVDAVAQAAPNLLAKIKDGAQKRSETDLTPLLHPSLLANKAKVYDLFDIANYRNHSLGRIVPEDNREVGVQFFQLTSSQVERLHYLMFSTYGGHLVLRDVVTGPEVANKFLRDEERVATEKLDLMFRALNDHNDSGLKTLCTPGMYESLKQLADEDASTLVRGKYTSIATIALTPSISTDSKSARVVVKVGYPDPGAKPLEYFVDFERVDKDLRVVRVRDLQGGVVAWDPNIDNYLNRRYGLPDGALVTDAPKSDDIRFYPLSMVHDFVIKALESRNAQRLKELGAEFKARKPAKGDGYGILAAAAEISGNFDDAQNQATLAIDRGGTAYFVLLRHNGALTSAESLTTGKQFSPVILGISKSKVEYIPFSGQGRPREEVATSSVAQSQLERRYLGGKPRPFLNLDFGGKGYNFAAFGTACPDDKPAPGLEVYSGATVCPPAQSTAAAQTKKGGILGHTLPGGLKLPIGGGNGTAAPMLVPRTWQDDLKVVAAALDEARRGGSAAK